MNAARLVVAVFVASIFAPRLRAQCPDGSAPPNCRATQPARPNPAPDARTWIVLPFTNTTRAVDFDWVSDASASVLAGDMARWSDLRVVGNERVRDLLRGVPQTERAQLGLQRALAIARRAGAGRLVMGEYVKEGARLTLVAKVFDVRTGKLVRPAVTQPSTTTDSIVAAYHRLAPRVLDVPLPIGTTLTGIGTLSTEAVRDYVLGMQALNRSRTDSAAMRFTSALHFDSTFALAHLRLALSLGANDAAARTRAFANAARFAKSLSPREQWVITLSQPGVARAVRCDLGGRLLALDSADAEGWLAVGQCSQGNARLVMDTHGQIRREMSFESTRRAYERVLDLQPQRTARSALVNMQLPQTFRGCTTPTPDVCPPNGRYWAALVLEHDTLVARFEPVRRFDAPVRRRTLGDGLRAKQTSLRDFLARWTGANPEDIAGHLNYAQVLINAGDLAGAARELGAASELQQLAGDNNRLGYNGLRAETEWKQGRPELAAALLDSTGAAWPEYRTAFGQFAGAAGAVPPAIRLHAAAFYAVYSGAITTTFATTMRDYAAADTADRDMIREVGTAFAFHALRAAPARDTASEFALFRFQAFLARGDTLRARRALAEYDTWADSGGDEYWDAHEMLSAESHVELGDTVAAWSRIEPFARRWPRYLLNATFCWSFEFSFGNPIVLASASTIGRAWLLYADLAIATGHRDEARRGYTMIVGMWEHGDPPVQPLVTRAKAALVTLRGP